MSKSIPTVRTHPVLGYERVRDWVGGESTVYVHQLVAIAHGDLTPAQAFSDGRWHVHHESGVPWDNRPSNLSAAQPEDHDGLDHHPDVDSEVKNGG